MTVAELIDWLARQPPDAPVLIRDPDTDWLMRLRVGDSAPGDEFARDEHHGAVIVHCLWDDKVPT